MSAEFETAPAPRTHLLLDRDGVLNRERSGQVIRRRSDWEWEATAVDALRHLASRDVVVSVVTNQSAVARGWLEEGELGSLHEWVAQQVRHLGVDLRGVYACMHAPRQRCACRKPAPGLVLEAMANTSVAPERTVVVGDDLRDMGAAEAAGVGSILVRTGKGTETERHLLELDDGRRITVVDTLLDAVVHAVG